VAAGVVREWPNSTAVFLTVGTVRAAVWRCVTSSGRLRFLFDWMQGRGVAPEHIQRLLNGLREIPDVAEQFEGVEEAGWRKRPFIPVSLLATPGVVEKVIFACRGAPRHGVEVFGVAPACGRLSVSVSLSVS
jgi:hypothetical protein